MFVNYYSDFLNEFSLLMKWLLDWRKAEINLIISCLADCEQSHYNYFKKYHFFIWSQNRNLKWLKSGFRRGRDDKSKNIFKSSMQLFANLISTFVMGFLNLSYGRHFTKNMAGNFGNSHAQNSKRLKDHPWIIEQLFA